MVALTGGAHGVYQVNTCAEESRYPPSALPADDVYCTRPFGSSPKAWVCIKMPNLSRLTWQTDAQMVVGDMAASCKK